MPISVTEPISRAIERSKFITFQPFNIAKWFTLGFIVFLAALDEGGGGMNYRQSFPTPGGRTRPVIIRPGTRPAPQFPMPTTSGTPTYPSPSPSDPFEEAWDWITTHVGLVIVIALAGSLLILAIWILILWLNSRAKFVYLEALSHDTFAVVEPWKRFRPLGNSLFGFRAALGAISLGAFIVIALIAFLVALPDLRAKSFGGYALASILIGALLFLPLAIMLSLIDWATKTFITHIMFATNQSTLPAWREFRQTVLPGNKGRFFLFLLMQALLSVAVAIAQVLIGCATCCIGLLPYLSSVVALPLHVFIRAYPVYFLQQFSHRYQIISEPPPPTGFPVMPLAGPGGYPPPQYMHPPPLPPSPAPRY
jgi:hypothetical protein